MIYDYAKEMQHISQTLNPHGIFPFLGRVIN